MSSDFTVLHDVTVADETLKDVWLHGVAPHPSVMGPGLDESENSFEFWSKDGSTEITSDHFNSGILFIDGSCMKYGGGLACRAGWAVIEMGLDLQPITWI